MPPSRIALLGVIYLAWCFLGAIAFSISFQRNPRFGTPPGSTASAPSPSALSNIIPLIDAKPTFASTTSLYGGTGTAETYSWKEEQFEIEIKLAVPPGTSAKDIKFKCASQSIDLRLIAEAGGEVVLLDGARKTRGAICVDGTFWSIETLPRSGERQVTVTVEKHFVPESTLPDGSKQYGTLTDFDWGGVYPNDEGEVSHREYDEAEELDVREYAAKLGVDIDNIDMSKVNKTMFGAGLSSNAVDSGSMGDLMGGVGMENNGKGFHFDINQVALDQLTKSGLAKEVVQQGDGTEFELDKDGMLNEDKKFAMLGKDVSTDELRDAGITGAGVGGRSGEIPPMFFEQTLPVEEAPGYQKTYDVGNSLVDGIIEDEILDQEIISGVIAEKEGAAATEDEVSISGEAGGMHDDGGNVEVGKPVDPISMLKVARLKEILRAQGLKVSGTKQVLQDRLRNHVNTLLEEEQ